MVFSAEHLTYFLSHQNDGPSLKLTSLQTEDSGQSHLWKGENLPWNGISCLTIVCYVLNFCSDCEHSDVFDTIRRLEDLAYEYREQFFQAHFASVLRGNAEGTEPVLILPNRQRMRQEIFETFVNIFWPKVQQFFIVPKGNGHLEGFINFLLQLLNAESHYVPIKLENQLLDTHMSLHKWLKTSLNYFLVVLGDIPFQYTDKEQVINVLIEFEVMANVTGSFIYSYFFRTSPIDVHAGQCWEDVLDLANKINSLKEKIEEHCIEFSKLSLPVYVNLMNTNAVDSMFIVESLLNDLRNFMTTRDDLTDELKHQTTTLRMNLLSAQSFLEAINVSEETVIQELKIQIRDTAYEAEYLFDSFVVGDFPVSYFSIRLPMINHKFELLREGFMEIYTVSCPQGLKFKKNPSAEAPTLKMVIAPGVMDHNVEVRFTDLMIEILDELTNDSMDLKFICINGMPGLGKTTIANRLYNHQSVTNRFDKRAWCVASKTYQNRNVMIEILTSLKISMLDKEKVLKMNDKTLIIEIHQTLVGSRYLIVIDDVWNSRIWDDLNMYAHNDRTGSRILFTTRVRDKEPINTLFYTPPFLSKGQCWEIIERKVFRDEPCPTQLRNSGKRIAAKCHGLPLAAVVIAGALVNMAKEKTIWEKVEGSLDTYNSDCMQILELSYHHLPDHLKLCFLYLGVFPENSNIPVRKLIQLWIAERLIRKYTDKSQEDVAEKYLMYLVNRNLVQVGKTRYRTGGVKDCSVHALLRDMCLRISKQGNFLNWIQKDHSSTNHKQQRFCVRPTSAEHLKPFSLYCRSYFGQMSYPSSCLPQMKRLRVMELVLSGNVRDINKFNNINLLYLRFVVTDKIKLEPVLDNLVNLEVLCIEYDSDVDISKIISKMLKLRHLYAKHAKFLTNCNNSQPSNLQSLSHIWLMSSSDCENLRYVPRLRKLKCICQHFLPDFGIFSELESLSIGVTYIPKKIPRYNEAINFPLSIKMLSLANTRLPWEKMSMLGKLPQLQSLKLYLAAFEGKKWETSNNEFPKLRFLKLVMLEIEQWISAGYHFPQLCHLVLLLCTKLQKIPTELGDIDTLQTIEVHDCSYGASISAVQIEQEQLDNSGSNDLQVTISNERWSKEQLVLIYNEEIPSVVHVGVMCDNCRMVPIVGDRYRCKDCTEVMSYDLCGACYSSRRSEIPGQCSQQHTSEHEFVLIDPSSVDQTLIVISSTDQATPQYRDNVMQQDHLDNLYRLALGGTTE